MDFAFGTLSTDELKLYHHQLMHQGVHHGHQMEPRKPKADEPITLFATTGGDVTAVSLTCTYTTDGSKPGKQNGEVISFTPFETVWDSFIWGYITRWQVTLPAFAKGTCLRYQICSESDTGEVIFADYPDLKLSSENAANRHFSLNLPPDSSVTWGDSSTGTTFTLMVDQPGAPDWAHDAIIYHLMVDRFNPGIGKEWLQTTDLNGFCGGTLQGVFEKLDYIESLGVNCIWLSPIWTSPSSHGYDTADYREVEPRLGNKKILHKLIDTAHDRGLRVLFDMACNHLSNHHPIFQFALTDSRSPYRSWFTFDDSEVGYRGFFGSPSMPEVKLTHPDARDWMIENALYWLREFDIDGYRLDYANGARPDFWSYFVIACKQEKPSTFYFGEIIESPDRLRPYLPRLDGALDFHINFALRQTYGWGKWSQVEFDRFLAKHQQYFSTDFVMPAFIDNHDMDRFSYITEGDHKKQLAAIEALMQLPNPPIIYYGTEIGISQPTNTANAGLEVSREPMRWGDEQDKLLLEKTRALIHSRRKG
jgi:cyclomaltodextrinase